MPYSSWVYWVFLILVLEDLFDSIYGKGASQLDYPACAINHNSKKYCCDHGNGEKYVFTVYHLPDGDASYSSYYRDGWFGTTRQVNFPYTKYQPSTPSFYYNDGEHLCRLKRYLDSNQTLVETLQCGSKENATLASGDPTIFMSYPGNARNNNASCPDGATWKRIEDWTEENACQSVPMEVHTYYSTYLEFPFILIYFVYALGLLLTLFWILYKRKQEQMPVYQLKEDDVSRELHLSRSSSYPSYRCHSSTKNYAAVALSEDTKYKTVHSVNNLNLEINADGEDDDDDDDNVFQWGISCNLRGTLVAYYLLFLSILLHVLLIIIIMDYYSLFGMPLMPREESILKAFILVFTVTTLWFIGIVLFQEKLMNFFRIQTNLETCEYVKMFQLESSEILLADRSGVSQLVSQIEKYLFPKSILGHGGTVKVQVTTPQNTRYIVFQNIRYVYNPNKGYFVPSHLPLSTTFHACHSKYQGLSDQEYTENFNLVGENAIHIRMPSLSRSIGLELFSFFYIYQIMSYYVWFYYDYYYMALLMVILIISSATVNIYTKRQMQQAVTEMCKYFSEVQVCRNGEWKIISTRFLVPGDLIVISENTIVPCDLTLVFGSCICDESNLTGESMPVQKIPFSYEEIQEIQKTQEQHLGTSSLKPNPSILGKRHTLFAGTKVLSSGRNERLLAVVRLTGAHTSRGQLIQGILHPIRMRFKYDEHLKLLLFFLCIYALFSSYLTISFLVSNGNLSNRLNSFGYMMFMISGILSPLLPVVITVGQVTAAKRLKKLGIYCLNSKRLSLSGKLRVFCFDKTGTLTKQGLDYLGFMGVNPFTKLMMPIVQSNPIPTSSFSSNNKMIKKLDANYNHLEEELVKDLGMEKKEELNLETMEDGILAKIAMATCHSVSISESQLIGSQVEVKMLESTNWKLIERTNEAPMVHDPVENSDYVIVKRFEFDHNLMSMSVIVLDQRKQIYYVFGKGSYEKMKTLCVEESVPMDYDSSARQLARDGCYVLGIGYKRLTVDPQDHESVKELLSTWQRDQVESELTLLGHVLFRNELKQDAKESILHLKQGDVRCVMITGDNALCGCYIARQCGMISLTAQLFLGEMNSSQDGVKWTDLYSNELYSHAEICERIRYSYDPDIELAITGKVFDYLSTSGEMTKLLFHVRIFSRMTPQGKIECVKMHMEQGVVTGMCGDGGNDCGALRIAHVGLALSDSEASIVSPFTSRPKTVQSVIDLCREGRCSLATSFASVKFLILYGLITSNLNHITNYNGVSNGQWFWIVADGILMVGFSYYMTKSEPLEMLHSQRPTSSLIGPTTLFSIMGQWIINIVFLALVLQHLVTQPWYCPFAIHSIDLSKWWLLGDNAISTLLLYCMLFQLQTSALVFTLGGKFRMPLWKNYGVCGLYALLLVFNLYLILGKPSYITDLFRIASGPNVIGLPDIPIPFDFRVQFLFYAFANILTLVVFEYLVIQGPIRNLCRKKFYRDPLKLKV